MPRRGGAGERNGIRKADERHVLAVLYEDRCSLHVKSEILPRLGCGRGRADAQGQDGQGRDEAGEQILHGADVSEASSDALCQDRAVI